MGMGVGEGVEWGVSVGVGEGVGTNTLIFLNGHAALGADLGVGHDPVGVLGLGRVLRLPLLHQVAGHLRRHGWVKNYNINCCSSVHWMALDGETRSSLHQVAGHLRRHG